MAYGVADDINKLPKNYYINVKKTAVYTQVNGE